MSHFRQGKPRLPLFPYKYKYPGTILLFIGLLSGYFYFFGGKPEFFTTPIFAFITSYAETRYFLWAQTNLLDEIAATGIIAGLIFIGFSKEINEKNEYTFLRFKALIYSVYISAAVWILFFMLVYGWTIFIFSTAIFLVFLLSFILLFRTMVIISSKSNQKT